MSWKLKKKCLDILAGEEGYVRKVWGDALTICLAYPNVYRTGMSNLGFQTVYALINGHPVCLCERAFLPDPGDEADHEASSPLLSLESQKPLGDFDMLAFSLSFENDYPHILRILELAGIPLATAARGEQDPLVIGGGIAATLNPEPLADFFDLFLIGDGEAVLPRFLDTAAALRRRLTREEFLAHVQKEIPGAYVPRFYRVATQEDGLIAAREPLDAAFPRRIERRWAVDLDAFPTEQVITTAGTEFGNMFLTEVSRGCPRGCRFCAAGFVCRPVRFRSVAALESSFRRGLEKRKTIGLLGTAVSDHPDLIPLCRAIIDSGGGSVAVGSLRMDRLSGPMAALLKETGVETVSLAPEAGSQRLRDAIRKGISEEQIFSAVEKLIEYDMVCLRLYFMVGLPTETDEDIEAICRLVKGIGHRARRSSAGRKGFRRITLSVNQFIPKPGTPFQWHPLEDTAVVRRRIRRIAGALRAEKAVRVTHDIPKWNYIQALLSLGDRTVGKLLLAVHRRGGNWAQAFKEVNVNPDFYVYRPKETGEILPWDFIDHGTDKQFLISEYRKALSGEYREDN
ncbi:MAG: radical SAM protein [Proteobacteria bacterium]|nr:radical SAM protein [Pseudomonadota bacterium]MBU2227522.1 radical SAM protein [Pseudomonadota bacterium]MBU2261342.1 radical SAM protein [Pseudomonadota bacterium]